MTNRERYAPSPASGPQVRKDGSPGKVWQALTGPAHLSKWAPCGADGTLGTVGTVKPTTLGAPATHALLFRLEDHLDGRTPADMFKRFADMRSLYV